MATSIMAHPRITTTLALFLPVQVAAREQRDNELSSRHARARRSIDRLAQQTSELQATLEEARAVNASSVRSSVTLFL